MSEAEPATEQPASESTTKREPRATCSCGHDFAHYMVSPDNDYTFWGWVLVWTGVSAQPRKVRFKCRDCGETFAETEDPVLCSRYR